MKPEEELQMVFDFAKTKFLSRNNKPGNTLRPWNDFPISHLNLRLDDEVLEYKMSGSLKELLDIINMAGILYIANMNRLSEGLGEEGELR